MTKSYPVLQSTDAAYMAGIVDGEGSIMMARIKGKKGSWWRITLSMGNCDRELMDWVVQFGGFVMWDRHTNRLGRRPHHIWTVTGNHARRIIPAIRPFLIIKARRADWAIRVLTIQANRLNGDRHLGYDLETATELESIHQQFRKVREDQIKARTR